MKPIKPIKPPPSGPSQRQRRVGELIRKALSEAFHRGDIYNPLLAKSLMTVSEVRMSVDLKHAFVFLAPLGRALTKDLREALKEEKSRLRRHIARTVELRFTPELHFEEDTSFAEADKINRLLGSLDHPKDCD